MLHRILQLNSRSLGFAIVGAFAFAGLLLMAGYGATAEDRSSEPGDLFPALEAPATEADTLPSEPEKIAEGVEMLEVERARLLAETNDAQYFVVEDSRGGLCMARLLNPENEGMPFNINCSDPGQVAENGLVVAGIWDGGPLEIAFGLPYGYDDQVVDQAGEPVGQVTGQLFIASFDPGEPRPNELVARGDSGELALGTRFLGGR